MTHHTIRSGALTPNRWAQRRRAQRAARSGGVLAMTIVAAVLALAGPLHAQIFDWSFNLGDPQHPGVTPLPELNNDSGIALASFLAGQAVPAVRVQGQLSEGQLTQFLDGPTPLTHVITAFSNPGNGGDAMTAVQVEDFVFDAGSTASSGARIGQFSLDPYHPDPTMPAGALELTAAAYAFGGVNTASPNLLPGSPTFRSPASANSSAPNIRSSLFTLPLTRLSGVSQATPGGDALLPFVSRFSSIGSPLVNSEYMGLPAYETNDQHLSRGDYQALVAHYRMRGADGVIAHCSGIVLKRDANNNFVPYTHTDYLDDTTAGWGYLDGTYGGDVTPVTLDTTVQTTGLGVLTFESAGVAWSGVVGESHNGQTVATVLLSNLSNGSVTVRLPGTIDGIDLVHQQRDQTVEALEHLVLRFGLEKVVGQLDPVWSLLRSSSAFEVPNDTHAGIGIGCDIAIHSPPPPVIPESGSVVAMLAGAGWLCSRRIRRPRV